MSANTVPPGGPPRVYGFGPYRFDPATGLLEGGAEETILPPKAAAVLEVLVRRPRQLVAKQELLETVWADTVVAESALTDIISVLRQALADDPRNPAFIQTIHRRGYRFVAEVEPALSSSAASGIPRVAWLAGRRSLVVAGLAAVVMAAVATFLVVASRAAPADRPAPVTRLTLELRDPAGDEAKMVSWGGGGPVIASSPPALIYSATDADQQRKLFARRLDRFVAEALPGTRGGQGPFLSPDGRSLGFLAADSHELTLKRLSLVDGGVHVIASLEKGYSAATWLDDGTIVMAAGGAGLLRVADSGGPVEVIGAPRDGHLFEDVAPLPSGDGLLFVERAVGARQSLLMAYDAAGERIVELGINGSRPTYVEPGVLLFARSRGQLGLASRAAGALFAVAFDARRLGVVGEPIEVLEDLAVLPSGLAAYTLAGDGMLIYKPGQELPAARTLLRVEAGVGCAAADSCAETVVTDKRRRYRTPRLSPDGKRVVVRLQETNGEHLWLLDLERDTLRPLTEEDANFNPQWTHDGRSVIFHSNRNGEPAIYLAAVNGATQVARLAAFGTSYDISPDGRYLVHRLESDLWETSLTDGPASRPLLATRGVDRDPEISPDGRWFLYVSNRTGSNEIYVRAYGGQGDGIMVSASGGVEPAWSVDGRQILYRAGDRLMAADFEPEPFLIGRGRLVLRYDYLIGGGGRHWEPLPGGDLLVIRGSAEYLPTSRYRVVVNWTRELRRQILPR